MTIQLEYHTVIMVAGDRRGCVLDSDERYVTESFDVVTKHTDCRSGEVHQARVEEEMRVYGRIFAQRFENVSVIRLNS